MFKPKTIIILVFSLLAGLLAVKAYTIATQAAPKAKKEIKKKAPPAPKAYSGSVPKGKRVVSIKVNEVSGATRALEKGDRVDIIAVTNANGSRGGKIARVVLQNVIIHDVEQSYFNKQLTDKITRKKKTWTLQLQVHLSQAVTLASVDEAAVLRLVLRNPGDDTVEKTDTIFYSPNSGPGPAKPEPELSGRIRPGMRAISLPVDSQDGLCRSLKAGHRVDVVVSFKLAGYAANQGNQAVGTTAVVTSHKKSSKIFLQDVEVMATDQSGNLFAEHQKPATRVTLMVTPKQAEKMAVITDASKFCQIRLILRHPNDRQKVATQGELFQDLIFKEKKAYRPIDTVRGTKVFPGKFYE
jgi:Flp pilus assembly protein CpaB